MPPRDEGQVLTVVISTSRQSKKNPSREAQAHVKLNKPRSKTSGIGGLHRGNRGSSTLGN